MSDDQDSVSELEDNYYTFLNLPPDATNDQINAAYRKLSRIYHPDKHVDVESKQKAEQLFNRTKRAYGVLSDPHKRGIYDSVGQKGLRTDGWELIHRTKTPAEIREEYERLSQAVEERKLQQKTNPRGNITVNVNATEIFSPYDDTQLPRMEVSSMSISQSIEAPLNRKDTLTLGENLFSSNGTRSENVAIDVTIPLQCLVKDGTLILYRSSKSELPGFYDPCIGEDKILKIEYKSRNQNNVAIFKDMDSVRLPLSNNN